MCGIIGVINFNGQNINPKILKKMTDKLVHRGPDGEGYWVKENIGFGHRRLSIVDLTDAASQPMVSTDGRFILLYNGEIYNYKKLKKELEKANFFFKSSSDTEVVLNSLIHWGTKALLKFNGMFALSLWDRKKNKLLIARDRYGIKPLYYYFNKKVFSFASEQKAILETDNFKKKINYQGFLEYFTFQNIFTDNTLFENIKIFPAGHYGYLDLNFKIPKFTKIEYWDFKFKSSKNKISKKEYKEELQRLLKQAVERQLTGDVEIGAYLSGGIDSSLVTMHAAEKISNLKSFTCGFDLSSVSGIELGFDEREKAAALSKKFKTDHHEMVLKSGDMKKCFNQLSKHIEEPRVGSSYPNYYIAKLASKFVKVVLSGTGGDEIFAGYPWRYYRSSNSSNFKDYIDQYYKYWQRLIEEKEINKLLSPISKNIESISTKNIFKNIFKNHSIDLNNPEDYINHSLYFEAKTFLHGLLVIEDKISMAHGVECRIPFLDNDLVDFAMKCPISLKLKNIKKIHKIDENLPTNKREFYFEKFNDGKMILRDLVKDNIDKKTASSFKQGFTAPDSSWFKGESIDYVRKQLLDDDALIYNFLDKKIARSLIQQHINGSKNLRLFIWSLLSVEAYLKNYI